MRSLNSLLSVSSLTNRGMVRTNLHGPMLKPSLPKLLALMIGFTLFMLEFGAAGRQTNQQQRTIDEKYSYPDCPVKIVEVETRSRRVVMGKPFLDNDDWMKGLTISVENKSGKVVTHIGIKIILERPESQRDQAGAAWDIWYGPNPFFVKPEEALSAPPIRSVQPGETESITLSPQDYDALVSFLRDINFASTTQSIHISVYTIGFADGTVWAGQLYRRDPKSPRGWKQADEPNASGRAPTGIVNLS